MLQVDPGRKGNDGSSDAERLPRKVAEEVGDILHTYAFTDEYITGLKKERAEVEERLMPRAGASLVKVTGGRNGMVKTDPTGRAGVDLACHPLIVKLDGLIEYWRERKEKVDELLPMLTETELQIIKFCYLEGPPENHSNWPKMSREELRQVRRQIIRKAARSWGLW